VPLWPVLTSSAGCALKRGLVRRSIEP
jgi:hypothetical protein